MGRTHLTTAPGEALREDGPSSDAERWVRGPSLPTEPSWPGRYRTLWTSLVALLVVLALVLGYVALNRRANNVDPTFSPELTETPSDLIPGDG